MEIRTNVVWSDLSNSCKERLLNENKVLFNLVFNRDELSTEPKYLPEVKMNIGLHDLTDAALDKFLSRCRITFVLSSADSPSPVVKIEDKPEPIIYTSVVKKEPAKKEPKLDKVTDEKQRKKHATKKTIERHMFVKKYLEDNLKEFGGTMNVQDIVKKIGTSTATIATICKEIRAELAS